MLGGTDTNGVTEWKAGLILLSRILFPQFGGTTTDLGDTEDVVGELSTITSISSMVVAPHELMHCVIGHSYSSGDDNNRIHQGSGPIRKKMTSTTSSRKQSSALIYSLKPTLYTILACTSIQSSASSTQTATRRTTGHHHQRRVVRWKRLQSMCMNCIELYQRLILSKLDRFSSCYEESNESIMQHLRGAMELYCQFVVTSIHCMVSVLNDAAAVLLEEKGGGGTVDESRPSVASSSSRNKKGPDTILIRSIQAGMISTTTTLAKHIARHMIRRRGEAEDYRMRTMG